MAIPKPQMSLYSKEEALMLEDLFKFHFVLPKKIKNKEAPKKGKNVTLSLANHNRGKSFGVHA